MNKIIVDNDNLSLDKKILNIDLDLESEVINVSDEMIINDFTKTNKTKELIINLDKNASLIYNKFSKTHDNLNITINLKDNSSFAANIGMIATTLNKWCIRTNMEGSNINNYLYVRCLTKEDGLLDIQVDGKVYKDTINNVMKESVKLLNVNNSDSRILPNMLVDTSEVEADHSVTMSGINENELFYLTSKGISKEDAAKLLENGFVLGVFDENTQELIKNL